MTYEILAHPLYKERIELEKKIDDLQKEVAAKTSILDGLRTRLQSQVATCTHTVPSGASALLPLHGHSIDSAHRQCLICATNLVLGEPHIFVYTK